MSRPTRRDLFALPAVALFSSCLTGQPPRGARGTLMEVSAGDRSRIDAWVECPLPQHPPLRGAHWRLHELGRAGEREIPVGLFIDTQGAARLAWTVAGELRAGETRRYRLSTEAAPPARGVEARDDGRAITFGTQRDRLARYHHQPPEPPAGVDAVHARSGYIHPLWTPSGQVVTGDFPASHRHQHGVFFAWTRTRFEGREVDFWNTGAGQGRVECVAVRHAGGPALATVRATHHHTDLTAPGGPEVALIERWNVRVHGRHDPHVLDLVSVQECAGDRALEVLEYHYGGMAFRGPEAWEGEAATFLTSERDGRAAGDGSRVRWCAASGPSPELATLAIQCHPDNLRAPQPVRIHPSNPYFCFSPCRLGAFSIEPGKPLTSRYRLIALDGPPDADELDRMWNDYADPPRVRPVAAGAGS